MSGIGVTADVRILLNGWRPYDRSVSSVAMATPLLVRKSFGLTVSQFIVIYLAFVSFFNFLSFLILVRFHVLD